MHVLTPNQACSSPILIWLRTLVNVSSNRDIVCSYVYTVSFERVAADKHVCLPVDRLACFLMVHGYVPGLEAVLPCLQSRAGYSVQTSCAVIVCKQDALLCVTKPVA